MIQTPSVYAEGANIVYDYEGNGPLLLTIVGGEGDVSRHVMLAHLLADIVTPIEEGKEGVSPQRSLPKQGKQKDSFHRSRRSERIRTYSRRNGNGTRCSSCSKSRKWMTAKLSTSQLAHVSCFLFRVSVPGSRKPLNSVEQEWIPSA